MGRNKDLAKNTAYVAIGSFGGSLIGFLMLPLYTRWLSPADYGVTDIISTYSSLLLFIVSFCISEAIFVFPVGQSKEKITSYYTTGWLFLLSCSVLCAVVFYSLSFVESKSSFFDNLWLIYITLISGVVLRYCQDFCRGIKKMSVFSFTGIIMSLGIALFSFVFIPHCGIKGYVIASVLASLCSALFAFLYSGSYRYFSIHSFDKECLKEMLKFSIPLIPTSVMWWIVSSLNRPLLEQYVGLFAIGLFAIANKLPSILNNVFGYFQKAWQVTVIEEFHNADFSVYYNRMFRVIFSVQVLLTIIITVFSKLFITIFTTEEYYSAWVYIPILSLSVLFSNGSAFCGTLFAASHETKYTFYSVLVGAVVAVVANFAFIPWLGLQGACIAICLSHVAGMISRIYFSSRYVKFDSLLYVLVQMLAVGVVYCGVKTENIYLIVLSVIIGCGLYYISNKNEIKNNMQLAMKVFDKWKKNVM